MSDWSVEKKRVQSRLRRAEGQVRAIVAMVEREEECEKVAQQLAAARRALDRAFYDVMACATRRAVAEAGGDRDAVDQGVRHITDVMTRYG